MPVPNALTHLFSGSSRARGQDYADTHRVRLLSVAPTVIEAAVRGTEMYAVRLAYELERGARVQTLSVSCTCPYFADGSDTCKHIWATLVVAADEPGSFLMALEDQPRGSIRIVGSDDLLLEEIEAEEPEIDRDPPPVRPWGRSPARPAPPAPQPPGRRFLAAVTHAVQAGPLERRPFLYRQDDLIYAINLDAVRQGLQIEVLVRTPKKHGGWGPPRPARLTPVDLQMAPPEDAAILSALAGASQAAGGYGEYPLTHAFPVPTALARLVVPLIAQTGRAHVRSAADDASRVTPVVWDAGAPWTYVITAEPRDGNVVIAGRFERDGQVLATGDRVTVYESGFLITAGIIARATLPASRALFEALLRSSPIELSTEEASTLAETLARSGASSLDLPEVLRTPEIDVPPVHRLSISPMRGSARDLKAVLTFEYDGTIVPADLGVSLWDPSKRRLIRRRTADEAAAAQRLSALGVRPRWYPPEQGQTLGLSPAAMPAVVRMLVAEGWRVDAEGRRYQRPSRVSMSVSSGIDWFDLEAVVEFAGETVPLSDVLAALRRGDASVRLDDGSMGLLPEEWLERYAPLAALGEADGNRLRFRLPQTALLDALLDAQADDVRVLTDARFDAARQELVRFDRIAPADPPASFHGELRPYQKEGLGWLGFLRRFGFGGCLADDMGLGKTVMVLALLDADRRERRPDDPAQRPSLVVAPRSVVHNWIAEAARFTPELRVRDHSHATRKANAAAWDDVDVVIATYGTLRRDITEMKDREFEYLILDEAQAIKNATTASAKAARLLRARHRLALTGTPIENHLGELWSLFEFLNPGLLGRSSVFANAGSGSRMVDPETAALLARGLRPFILRRTKAQVATDLPPKTEQTIVCDLEGKQRTLYNSLRAHYRQALLGRIDRVGLGKSKIQVLEALLRLRQAALHPGLVDPTAAKAPSAKLDALIPRLREVVDEGHKALVFSQFTSFLAIVRDALEKQEIVFEYLDGQTRDRAARVARFQTDPDCPVFLVSLKAGGLGLNLTAAEYALLLDPWWNPAVEAQAIDRAHRIGQSRHVFAYRLIARDTVEEKVIELQQTKRSLADAILRADAGLIGQLGREDLELLLS